MTRKEKGFIYPSLFFYGIIAGMDTIEKTNQLEIYIMKNAKEVLGFDPKSDTPKCFMCEFTPEKGKYILDHHNNNNRELKTPNVNKIIKAIEDRGYYSPTLEFTKDGEMSNGQHTTLAMIQKNMTEKVFIHLGVDDKAFKNIHPGNQRTEGDLIWISDPLDLDGLSKKEKSKVMSDRKTDVFTLKDIAKRKGGVFREENAEKMENHNTVDFWFEYKDDIITAREISVNFQSRKAYSSQGKAIRSFCAIACNLGYMNQCRSFIDMLDDCYQSKKSCKLGEDFYECIMKLKIHEDIPFKANEGKYKGMYMALCIGFQKFKDSSDGEHSEMKFNELNLTGSNKQPHGKLYREFLVLPKESVLYKEKTTKVKS